MAYRPARFLLYSEDRPARHPEEDAAQPVLQKIFDITKADSPQRDRILVAWREHEDARRVLWAAAFPRRSGPRILDPEKLEELDSSFETTVFDVLRADQKEALSMELPPPGTPHTPPPQMYADPRQEE